MFARLYRSEKLLLLVPGISLLHHLDHVLRADRSGWPFVARVPPFTYSLLVILLACIGEARRQQR